MFQSINQWHTRLPRVVLILILCAVALLPLAALADGTGGIEPPIQSPDPDGSSAEDGLILLGIAILSTLWTIP